MRRLRHMVQIHGQSFCPKIGVSGGVIMHKNRRFEIAR
jgi:hypothetical protein